MLFFARVCIWWENLNDFGGGEGELAASAAIDKDDDESIDDRELLSGSREAGLKIDLAVVEELSDGPNDDGWNPMSLRIVSPGRMAVRKSSEIHNNFNSKGSIGIWKLSSGEKGETSFDNVSLATLSKPIMFRHVRRTGGEVR
ncbi:unnamed protein product [Microthlaspi erraticum]|uniref:Uncharacterized protein n=1 Tax=Microthlaspi erraticum TaxID=1685480 RepID=A0A6D2IBG2_9BRAS|nr:unnamed protein product [Microthlaspi erraticum]